MDDLTATATIYSSPSMQERRRRVLNETRKLLEERGFNDFSTRELCERSQIAIRTFYHVFGSKDRVIAQSVYNVVRDNRAQQNGEEDPDSIEAVLTLLTRSARFTMSVRAYAAAVMSVYGAIPGFPEIRSALRDACFTFLRPYVEHLHGMGALVDETSVDWLVRLLKTNLFGLINDWCVGEIDDDQLVDGHAENLLVLIGSATKGYVQLEAEHWLHAVRAGQDRWLDLRDPALGR